MRVRGKVVSYRAPTATFRHRSTSNSSEVLQYFKSKLLVIHPKTLIFIFFPFFPYRVLSLAKNTEVGGEHGSHRKGGPHRSLEVLEVDVISVGRRAMVIFSHAEYTNLAVELLDGKVVHGFPGVPNGTYLTDKILVSINGILVSTIKLIISCFPPDSRWKRWRW